MAEVRHTADAAPRPFSAGEFLLLVALYQRWNDVADLVAERSLRERGLVAGRPVRRRHKGRFHQVEVSVLTGAGEAEAAKIWAGLPRPERAKLRAQALRAGL
ncbi:MAG TPA: hypothetical protein VF619_08915 [Allosphingosinicella sp.]|jgi:hypothetical protein